MSSYVRRWIVAPVTAVVLFATALSSCGGAGMNRLGTEFRPEPSQATAGKSCPPVPEYTTEEQAQAYDELEAAGFPPMLGQIMDDYKFVRDACT